VTERDLLADLSTVAPDDRRRWLEALRDRLAREADEVTWDKHKRECTCVCGMGDGRTLVAVLKELRAVLDAIELLPVEQKGSRLDRIAAARDDELAERRTRRGPAAASS
jgi:hypothetical protein